MKLLFVFFGFIFSFHIYFGQCNNISIDLNTWSANGGTWNVNGGGNSVTQTVNGGAVYFLSPQSFINVIISGRLRTDDADDDRMGFIFGVEGTIGVAPFHYYRLEWDQGGNNDGLHVKEFDETGLLSTPLALVGNHWTRSFNHDFTLTYQSSKIIIAIDGTEHLELDGCYSPGKFGFFNSSQPDVTYSNFKYLPTPDYQFISNDSICIYEPAIIDIFCLNNSTSTYAEVKWDFGDGTVVSNVTNGSHYYSNPGVYNLELYVKDFFGCEATIIKQITVFDPTFTLGADQNICPDPFGATFTSSNTTPGNIYNWSSGESSSSITKNISNQYRLTLTDLNGCIAKDTVNLVVATLPNVSFIASSECVYDSVSFTNTSLSSTSSYWDFGDSFNSSTFDTYHTFNSSGNKNVKLVNTFDNGCKDSIQQQVTIYAAPNAQFSFVNDCYNKSATFNNQSTITDGSITNWKWELGDGDSGSTEHAIHSYNSDGSYEVELILNSNNNCFDTVTHTITRYPTPTAIYSANPECVYDEVLFNDNSTINAPDAILGWEWSFGAGINSTNQSPNILFPTAGTKQVKLIVTSNHGCKDSISQTIDVFHKPIAGFNSSDGCNDIPTTFINTSTVFEGYFTEWRWDLGDGSTALDQNLTHNYVFPNTYITQLIVTTDKNCKDTITKTIIRHPLPIASFDFSKECLYDFLPFNNESTIENGYSIVDYSWNFGDGTNLDQNENTTHQFVNSGFHEVKLTVTSNYNCMDDTTILVEAYAVPQVNFLNNDKCINGGPALFNNGSSIISGNFSSWNWDFDDGFSSSATHPLHQYNNSGVYNVKLIGISNNGCTDTIVKVITIFNKPTASFDIDNAEGCIPLCIQLTDLSTDDDLISFRQWAFDDHNPSLLQDPNLCYENEGEFDISLIVTNPFNCKDTLIQTDIIQAWPTPIADFELSTQNTDILDPIVTISNTSYDADKWIWNLGNNDIDSLNYDIINNYNEAGLYTISLSVRNQYGCIDSLSKELIVKSKAFHYVPNSFTPNSDGINDAFKIEADDFNFDNLTIFDRWGKVVFYSEDIDQSWNGTTNGVPSKKGTYVWVLRYIDKKDNKQIDKGSVTLIR